ncbi:MAG: hypothetical protein ABSG51_13285 [Terracidiphilus sp.]|jgi:hypothetical protein
MSESSVDGEEVEPPDVSPAIRKFRSRPNPTNHRAGQAQHKIKTEILMHSLRVLICGSYGSTLLKGRDFSRAEIG